MTSARGGVEEYEGYFKDGEVLPIPELVGGGRAGDPVFRGHGHWDQGDWRGWERRHLRTF